MRTVRKFLDYKHKGRYMVFNLCAEKEYDAANFDGRAQHIPFLDHNPPSLRQMKLFCHSVSKWLRQNENNIVAVHCKGGKGRTGVMCAAWLLHQGFAEDVQGGSTPIPSYDVAAKYFEERRTADLSKRMQGVTGLSQMESLKLYDMALKQGEVPSRPLRVKAAVVKGVPFGKKGNEKSITPYLRISTMAGLQLWMGAAQEHSSTPGLADHQLHYTIDAQAGSARLGSATGLSHAKSMRTQAKRATDPGPPALASHPPLSTMQPLPCPRSCQTSDPLLSPLPNLGRRRSRAAPPETRPSASD